MKFKPFQKVLHLKTDAVYFIIGTPDKLILERTTEPAYAYQEYENPNAKIWIRCQSEMEDGRFILLSNKVATQEGECYEKI